MSPPSAPTPRAISSVRPTPHGDANAIVSDLMAEIRERKKAPPPPRQLPQWARYSLLMLLWAVCAWFWIAPPAALLPEQSTVITAEQRHAGARLALALHASRVDAFRARTGRLPATAREAGISTPEINYRRLSADVYELAIDSGTNWVLYRSDVPRDEFLGHSVDSVTGAKP